jgi:endonuclease/exonuclease/phosphatase family metal-dependent hydrolase
MYQEGLFRPISAKQIAVAMGDDNAATRNILYVQGVLAGDTVHVFVNHWPSRRTENVANTLGDPRLRAAQVLRRALVEVYCKAPKADIIVLGDFNDNPSDSSLQLLSGTHAELFNPFAKLFSPDSVGTEVYGGQWNLFDQVLMSRSFLASGVDKLSFRAAQIFKPAFLLNRQREPRRSFIGSHWANGYSDHLPVLVEFGWVARN